MQIGEKEREYEVKEPHPLPFEEPEPNKQDEPERVAPEKEPVHAQP